MGAFGGRGERSAGLEPASGSGGGAGVEGAEAGRGIWPRERLSERPSSRRSRRRPPSQPEGRAGAEAAGLGGEERGSSGFSRPPGFAEGDRKGVQWVGCVPLAGAVLGGGDDDSRRLGRPIPPATLPSTAMGP